MADITWFIISFLSPLIFRYHLPLNRRDVNQRLDDKKLVFWWVPGFKTIRYYNNFWKVLQKCCNHRTSFIRLLNLELFFFMKQKCCELKKTNNVVCRWNWLTIEYSTYTCWLMWVVPLSAKHKAKGMREREKRWPMAILAVLVYTLANPEQLVWKVIFPWKKG